MTTNIENEFYRMRVAYDLYGFVKISNALESWQVDALEIAFDDHYKNVKGFTPSESPERLPPIGRPLESNHDFLKVFSSASYVMKCVEVIAGEDCQYLGSDILCVYDDSIGAHRDTLYDFDTPKVLVFLSDCNNGTTSVPEPYLTRNFSGAFAVLSGSQYPNNTFNSLAAQLSDWPSIEQSVRRDLTPHFLRGDARQNGDYLYPYIDYDSRYQGYSYIPFKRGDVVIFSTRALHALLPTFSNHFAKLAGILFLEGYSKFAGRKLKSDVSQMDDNELAYLAMPYNLRCADALTKGVDYQTALDTLDHFPMGLKDQLALGEPLVTSVFEPKTMIYRMLSRESDVIKKRAFSSPSVVMDGFYKNFNKQRSDLKDYHEQMNASDLLGFGQIDKSHTNMIDAIATDIISQLTTAQSNNSQQQELISVPTSQDFRFNYTQKIKSILRRVKRFMLK